MSNGYWSAGASCLIAAFTLGCAAETGVASSSAALACAAGFDQRYDLPTTVVSPQRYASGASLELPPYGYLTSATVRDADDDALLLIVDGAGEPLRAMRFGDAADELRVNSIAHAHDGSGVVVTGRVDADLWIAHIEVPSGTVRWSRRIGMAGWYEEGTFVRQLRPDEVGSDDHLVVGRITELAANPFWNFAYLARVGGDGTLRWARRYDDVAAAFPTRDYETVAVGDGPEVLVAGIRNELSSPATRDVSLLRVRVTTGDNVPTVDYYRHVGGILAERTPHVVETSSGYAMAYSVRVNGSSGALLTLDAGRSPVDARWFMHPGGGDNAHSIFWDGRLRVSTTFGNETGFLSADPSTVIVDQGTFGHPAGEVSPMSAVPGGYLLRSNTASSLSLALTDPDGQACCREPFPLQQEPVDVLHLTTTYEPTDWGVDADFRVPGPLSQRLDNTPCL